MTYIDVEVEVEAVARRILTFFNRRRPMETNNPARLAESSLLLSHPNRRLHALAHLEIGLGACPRMDDLLRERGCRPR